MAHGRPWYKRNGEYFWLAIMALPVDQRALYSCLVDIAMGRSGAIKLPLPILARSLGMTLRRARLICLGLAGNGMIELADDRISLIANRLLNIDHRRSGLPKALRRAVLDRDGHACRYCGASGPLHVDHILAVALGGTDDLANLAAACIPCNLSKGAKTLGEWLA